MTPTPTDRTTYAPSWHDAPTVVFARPYDPPTMPFAAVGSRVDRYHPRHRADRPGGRVLAILATWFGLATFAVTVALAVYCSGQVLIP